MKPTQQQIKVFWEWCGFRYGKYDYVSSLSSELNGVVIGWLSPEATSEPYKSEHFIEDISEVKIDLNNLFKYAVPKLDHYLLCNHLQQGGGHIASVTLNGNDCEGINKDPALALFWALDSVREASDGIHR